MSGFLFRYFSVIKNAYMTKSEIGSYRLCICVPAGPPASLSPVIGLVFAPRRFRRGMDTAVRVGDSGRAPSPSNCPPVFEFFFVFSVDGKLVKVRLRQDLT